MNNHRWFLLFITWVWVGGMFLNLVMWQIKDDRRYWNHPMVMPLITGAGLAVGVGIFFFSAWHWYLALKGVPQIEFMQNKVEGPGSMLNNAEAKFTYGCSHPMDNLHVIFGTRSLIGILMPIER